jgi:SAM-dependent methyltransferase
LVYVVSESAQTWHYGLIAKWWAEFSTDGPEIAYFQRFVEDGGGPALDAACGTGRLLVPYLAAGLDVDGCDISPDMLEQCRVRAEREGLAPNLYAQALHELDLPRRYRTIVLCGGFGLGGNRADDAEALRRLCEHLEPGGVLVLDNEVPYAGAEQWTYWSRRSGESCRRTGLSRSRVGKGPTALSMRCGRVSLSSIPSSSASQWRYVPGCGATTNSSPKRSTCSS